MPIRNRSRYSSAVNGIRTRFGSPVGGDTYTTMSQTTSDYVGPGDNDSFFSDFWEYEGGIINSDWDGGFWLPTFNNYRADALRFGGQLPLIQGYDGELSSSDYAAQVTARTNPSRPYVDVPANILELGDVVDILRHAGKSLIDKVAHNNLKYQFGIAPLVSDLVKLTQFQEQVDRRVLEIKKLGGPRGLRRTLDLASFTTSQKTLVYWQTADTFMVSEADSVGTRKIRGHIRWFPAIDVAHLSQPEMSALARDAVLGYTIDFATLWEAMPWSWLIDWGSNIGDFLKANRNIIPAICSDVRIIKQTSTEHTNPSIRVNQHVMSAVRMKYSRKERYVASVLPTAHFPFLSGNQVGILASLYVTRR